MIKVPYYSKNGEELEPIEIDETIFGEKILFKTLHQMVVGYGRSKRVGTHSTKTKAEVAGSGRKPWRQKGTGRARAGYRRSPVWRKGGVAHGPKPRDYRWKLPVKMRRAALNSALLAKLKDDELRIVEAFDFEDDAPKTKVVASMIAKVLKEKKSCLIGVGKSSDQLYLSARNIDRLKLSEVRNFNAYDVVRHKFLILTKDALDFVIEARKSKEQ